MNEEIIKQICNELNLNENQVKETLKLLMDGNTIPFIARYRKELTGSLDEDKIKSINEVYEYQVNLLKRKEDVIRLIDEKGLLTEELKNSIMSSSKLVEVEDLYRPYKEKKKTKATEAIKLGLEPLAKKIMSFPSSGNIDILVKPYINENVTKQKAIEGAKYIIAEYVSDNAYYRKNIRRIIYQNGIMVSKIKKNAKDLELIYKMYYDFKESVQKLKPHTILALNRGENENILSVNIEIDKNLIINFLEEKTIKNKDSFVVNYVKEAIEDSYKRLIFPSIEREIRSDLKEKADYSAIENFSKNLENLLMTPPIKEKIVLAFDPGFTNGCKLAIIDKVGKYLYSTVIKPFSGVKELEEAKKVLLNLIKTYNIDIVAIGNGTASRESEKLISTLIKENDLNIKYVIVSEAGASIYSVEKIAALEFPDLSPNERSAISIGRRLQDPLSELVKIPPSGIGVGMYQHDVSQTKLKENLDFVVEKVVNSVGVNINTASSSLLKYVSGINSKVSDKIIEYRNKKGKILSREELKKNKILTDKTYTQSIGFLRITYGSNILDTTSIHPESYDIVLKLLESLDLTLNDIGSSKLSNFLDNIDIDIYTKKLNIDKYTLEDIISALKKPNRDPRDEIASPILKSDVLELKDLKKGMKLQGTVRNVVDFGAFIDIGLHNDGLVHISKISNKYIKHPSEVLSVGDIVDCYVYEILEDKKKVNLSLLKEDEIC